MTYKTISISGKVLKITKKETPKLSNFYGKWKMTDKEERIFKDINTLWSNWKID